MSLFSSFPSRVSLGISRVSSRILRLRLRLRLRLYILENVRCVGHRRAAKPAVSLPPTRRTAMVREWEAREAAGGGASGR